VLNATKDIRERINAKLLESAGLGSLGNAYRRAKRRLIFLDYDGTLTPLVRHPDLAVPSSSMLELLKRLTLDARNTVVIISGRSRQVLAAWFNGLQLGLVAEHGIWRRENGSEWDSLVSAGSAWKSQVFPVMEAYADRLPGAMVEEKEHSLVWHYRMADSDQAELLAAELTDQLLRFVANQDVQVIRGSKVIEIRPAAVNKGLAARDWLVKSPADFVLAAGDDVTDEDMFAALPEGAYSIRVGASNTRARFHVENVQEVVGILESLVETDAAVMQEPSGTDE
jgi:trehalose 6-phosphate synthase/phosphatase